MRPCMLLAPRRGFCRWNSGANILATSARTHRRTISSEPRYGESHSVDHKTNQAHLVLAIETSCDDTSVAVVLCERVRRKTYSWTSHSLFNVVHHEPRFADIASAYVLYHKTITANNDAYRGIHPLVSLDSHRANLAPLIKEALPHFKEILNRHPDEGIIYKPLIAVTRGPGMRSSLSVGIDTAKGLATAFNVPLLGVHHMQAHALTPRLVSALRATSGEQEWHRLEDCKNLLAPEYPFLTLLVSGGHTMLLDSSSLTDHHIIAESQDIALGEFLDKAGRIILPAESLQAPYGRALERFAFHAICRYVEAREDVEMADSDSPYYLESLEPPRYAYKAPRTHSELMERHTTESGWSLTPPLTERAGGESKRLEFTYSGLLTAVERMVDERTKTGTMTLKDRHDLARYVQRVAFEHLASRVLLFLDSPQGHEWQGDTLVVSGGVAANRYLHHVLRSNLDVRGYEHIKLEFPPVALATDNALMIAWAGSEMYGKGLESQLSIGPIRKWSMDSSAPDGGVLGAEGWTKSEEMDKGREEEKSREQEQEPEDEQPCDYCGR